MVPGTALAGRQRLEERQAAHRHKLHNKHTPRLPQGCFLLAHSAAGPLGAAETRGCNASTRVTLKQSVASNVCSARGRGAASTPPLCPMLASGAALGRPRSTRLPGGAPHLPLQRPPQWPPAASAGPGLALNPTLILKTPLLRPSFCCYIVSSLVRDTRELESKAHALR